MAMQQIHESPEDRPTTDDCVYVYHCQFESGISLCLDSTSVVESQCNVELDMSVQRRNALVCSKLDLSESTYLELLSERESKPGSPTLQPPQDTGRDTLEETQTGRKEELTSSEHGMQAL